jgi:hypothetical protein
VTRNPAQKAGCAYRQINRRGLSWICAAERPATSCDLVARRSSTVHASVQLRWPATRELGSALELFMGAARSCG